MIATEVADLTVAALAMGATGLGTVAAFFSRSAAKRASAAAEELTQIERHRWHTDLTPDIKVDPDVDSDGGIPTSTQSLVRPILQLTLIGPSALDQLDSLVVRIEDDRVREPSGIAGGPSAEDIAAAIWGPFRLAPHTEGIDSIGRSGTRGLLKRGGSHFLPLVHTNPPRHYAHDWYKDQFQKPIRMTITCHREGHEPWTIFREVSTDNFF